MGRDSEMVLVASDALARSVPDPTPFARELARAAGDVACFPNLGGDALLVVPVQRTQVGAYAHLASFVRSAPSLQVDRFLSVLGTAIAERIGDAPLWVSTAGLGVSWLHVRLDTRPKYYRHDPYRTVA